MVVLFNLIVLIVVLVAIGCLFVQHLRGILSNATYIELLEMETVKSHLDYLSQTNVRAQACRTGIYNICIIYIHVYAALERGGIEIYDQEHVSL